MIKLVSFTLDSDSEMFVIDRVDNIYDSKYSYYELCKEGLTKFLSIPDDCEKLTFLISDKEFLNSTKVLWKYLNNSINSGRHITKVGDRQTRIYTPYISYIADIVGAGNEFYFQLVKVC